MREGVLSAAMEELARPAPRLLATAWARAFRDGRRSAYGDRAWALQQRVSLLVPAPVLTGEAAASSAASGDCRHPDAAVDGLVAFAEATTWCWAPHDRVTAARKVVAPDPDDPFLDLGAAEVAALFAWADHVLGSHLDRRMPGLRRRLRREVHRRVLTLFERERDWHWTGADGTANNRNPWIHSAVLAAALLLCDDGRPRARLVRHAAHVVVEDRRQGRAERLRLHHVRAGEVECGKGWATVTGAGGEGLRMLGDPHVAVASVEHRAPDDPPPRRSWGARLSRLTPTVGQPAAEGRIAVRWQRNSGERVAAALLKHSG
ncbi:hypothetical protein [Streptomyces sp. NPDC056154]|uniref:hypothetical protein n=1 Tax=unclassified Streptomyces TaxID=2593676 RepID=UPI0035E373BB